MDSLFFLKGLLLGFSVAMPVGPIGVLCIQRTIAYGRKSGFITGLGAATADALYGVMATGGLTLISNFLITQQFWFRLIGGFFLVYLGIKTLFNKTPEKNLSVTHKNLFLDYASTLLLTITNPLTIIFFIAVFGSFGLVGPDWNFLSALLVIFGVAIGSAIWWLILSGGVSLFRAKLSAKATKYINIISGLIIIGFAVLAFISIMKHFK